MKIRRLIIPSSDHRFETVLCYFCSETNHFVIAGRFPLQRSFKNSSIIASILLWIVNGGLFFLRKNWLRFGNQFKINRVCSGHSIYRTSNVRSGCDRCLLFFCHRIRFDHNNRPYQWIGSSFHYALLFYPSSHPFRTS